MLPFERVVDWAEASLGLSAATGSRLVGTIFTIALVFVLRRVSRRVLARAIADTSTRYLANKGVAYGLGVIGLIALLRIWTDGMTGMATYLGLASAGLAIALQDPLTNLAGWLFIIIRSPFSVGDRIQIGSHVGDVVDIRIFRTILLEIGNWVHADQSTGRLIHVPNGWVFKNTVASYDQAFGYIWNELELTLTFESNWKKAKDVLTRTVSDHAEKLTVDAQERLLAAAEHYHIKFAKLTPVVWTSVADSGIRLTMRYLCRPRERRSSASEIWESVLESLEGMPDVDLAYPTTRFYDNLGEGKLSKASPSTPSTEPAATPHLPDGGGDVLITSALAPGEREKPLP
jgi:small-conductance mechanosensitive channel